MPANNKKKQGKRHELIQREIESLNQRIAEETPKRGYAPPLDQQVTFASLPISQTTLQGLTAHNFEHATAIQHACIPHALAGRDILGAAKTGSGKTLAFCVPVFEKLYRERYSPSDGCAAIILSPTRELAVQIFSVVQKVGAHHALTAGLLVGGKKEFQLEQRHVGRTNLLVATPGRLLQHLEQTPDLDVSNLEVLVLDEADRILDLGFRGQVMRILEYLPTERQTMLFSATQTRKVSDLAALSLRQPEYLGVHDDEKQSTPDTLQQSLIVVPLEHKLNAVYSFVKSHLKCKSIIFLASCSQVRHAWELFCALQPGIPIMALHGKLAQEKRTQIYFDFIQRPHAVLFATDVASRGLDFPQVDWVVQMDAPEDKDMYIHRVGRTARYKARGKALLMVTPSEEAGMMSLLTDQAKIEIKKLSINPTKTVQVTQKAAGLVASRLKLKELAEKAFKSYLRSVHLMPNKDIFKVQELPFSAYAESLGLPATPKLKFAENLDRERLREKKNVNHKLHRLKQQIKEERLAKRNTNDGQNGAESKKRERQNDEDELLVVKQQHVSEHSNDDAALIHTGLNEVSNPRQAKKIRVDGSSAGNKHVLFDDDGEEQSEGALATQEPVGREALESSHDDYVAKVRARLSRNHEMDRAEAMERVREKHRKKRLKDRGERALDEEEHQFVASLGDREQLSSPSSDDDSSDDISVQDSDSEGEQPLTDVKAQEELALAMIRGM
jgi:ATP-dependent RNA helicase DDX10/DBP4